MKNINAAADLITQYTVALVIAASLKYFGMSPIADQPTENGFQFPQDRSQYVRRVMEAIIDQYALPSINEMQQDSPKLSCPNCRKTYITQTGLKTQLKNKHPGIPQPAEHVEGLAPKKDVLFNYSRTALSLGLLAYNFNYARRMGDGDRIIRLYKIVCCFILERQRKPNTATSVYGY